MTKAILNQVHNVTMSWATGAAELPPSGTVCMEITWTPPEEIACIEYIQLTDERHFHKDIKVVFKSFDPDKKTAPTTAARGGAIRRPIRPSQSSSVQLVQKKPKIKMPSPKRQQHRQKVDVVHPTQQPLPLRESNRPIITAQRRSPPMSLDKETVHRQSPPMRSDKENQIPNTPPNASALFDHFCFTPNEMSAAAATAFKNQIDYLASMPTPTELGDRVNYANEMHETPQRKHKRPPMTEIGGGGGFDRVPLNMSALCALKTPTGVGIHPASTSTVISSTATTTLARPNESLDENLPRCLVYDKTFDISSSASVGSDLLPPPLYRRTPSPQQLLGGRMCSPVPTLSMIQEEDCAAGAAAATATTVSQTTFNVSPVRSKVDIQRAGGTPLRKKFQSMAELNTGAAQSHLKDAQGSMPNLHQIELMKPIENNRYFYQSLERDREHQQHQHLLNTSTNSLASVNFSENEFCAQSSQFNLNRVSENQRPLPPPPPSIFINFAQPAVVVDDDVNAAEKTFRVPSSATVHRSSRIEAPTSADPSRKRSRDESLKVKARIQEKMSPPKRQRNASVTSMASSSSSSNGGTSLNSLSPSDRRTRRFTIGGGSSVAQKTTASFAKFKMPKFTTQAELTMKQYKDEVILYDPDFHIHGKFYFLFLKISLRIWLI